jgi:hypothetical protein
MGEKMIIDELIFAVEVAFKKSFRAISYLALALSYNGIANLKMQHAPKMHRLFLQPKNNCCNLFCTLSIVVIL